MLGDIYMSRVSVFFDYIKDKKISFIGVGVSHNDLIRLFLKKGFDVSICDAKTLGDESIPDKDKFSSSLFEEFSKMGAKFYLGKDEYMNGVLNSDIVFRTPGMYFNHPDIKAAREKGVIVTSETELFFDLCPCKTYAITGSDGKSTTTTLVKEFFERDGKKVFFGGNIGKPLLSRIEEITENDVAVVELSSFQLISMRESPYAAAITNITPNHLNVHGTMEEYIESKCNILYHQNAFSKAVLNYDNENTRSLAPLVRGNLSFFSRQIIPETGSFLSEDGWLCYNDKGSTTKILHKDDIKIPGIHNVENFLTAIALTWGDVSAKSVVQTAKEFGGVEHRIEFVRELDNVRYYNDSIASSPTRVMAGLNSFDRKLIVIMGGSDKGISFAPMAPLILKKVKLLIVMGETAKAIRAAVEECEGFAESGLKIIDVKNMNEAVKTARENAVSGDIVSLSPACASFDMYRMFEERGNHFKQLVNEL